MLELELVGAAAIESILFSDRKPLFPEIFANSAFESRRAEDSPKRVLVIDDEELIADTIAEILIIYGYDAIPFYSGQSAIEAARKQCPDFILSDVLMPKLNGIETAIKIRELCPKAQILLLSGQAGTMDLLEQARARGYDFELLAKPLHPEELLKKLDSLY